MILLIVCALMMTITYIIEIFTIRKYGKILQDPHNSNRLRKAIDDRLIVENAAVWNEMANVKRSYHEFYALNKRLDKVESFFSDSFNFEEKDDD